MVHVSLTSIKEDFCTNQVLTLLGAYERRGGHPGGRGKDPTTLGAQDHTWLGGLSSNRRSLAEKSAPTLPGTQLLETRTASPGPPDEFIHAAGTTLNQRSRPDRGRGARPAQGDKT